MQEAVPAATRERGDLAQRERRALKETNDSKDTQVQSDSTERANVEELVELLKTSSRRTRQHTASDLGAIAKQDPETLVMHADAFIEALNLPEAQTRWELLEVLTILVAFDARTCSKAIPEAEAALFDEESGPVRLGAMKFLCKLGATTANRSEKVWPLIDEGIQCYHGDLEFNDMLTALVEFSKGKLSPQVKKAFSERMAFDAENARGTLKKRAQTIIDNLA